MESRLTLKDNKVSAEGLLEVPLASQARSDIDVRCERSEEWVREMAALLLTDLEGENERGRCAVPRN